MPCPAHMLGYLSAIRLDAPSLVVGAQHAVPGAHAWLRVRHPPRFSCNAALARVTNRVVGQFGSRFTGKGPNMSLKNKTNNAIEITAIHHGLSTIGNKTTGNHAHQGIRNRRL